MAAHDEDDLHRAKLLHVELATHVNGDGQFCQEDGGEDGNRHRVDDVVDPRQVRDVRILVERYRLNAQDAVANIEDYEEHTHTKSDQANDSGGSKNNDLEAAGDIAANDPDLQDQRAIRGSRDQDVEDV